MKLEQYFKEQRWTSAAFAREYKIALPVLRNIINGKCDPCLKTAVYIEYLTKGAVKAHELCMHREKIFWGKWNEIYEAKQRKTKKVKEQPIVEEVSQASA